jgi:GAF domain-containing protein/HAMP domain-containing protein
MLSKTQAKQPKRSTSLATTLATTFVFLSVLILIAVGSYQLYHDFQIQQQLVLSSQRLEASRAAETVASFIRELFNTLDAGARVGRLEAVPTEERRLWLDNLLGAHVALQTLSYIDEKGQELAKVSRLSLVNPSSLRSYADTELFTQVRQDQYFISSVAPDPKTYEPVVTLGIPVKNVFGDIEGGLVAEVNLKLMWEVIDRVEVGETGLAYVVDRQGNLIAYQDRDLVLQGANVGHLAEVAEFITDEEDELSETSPELWTGIRDELVLSTFVPLGTPDWAVIVELPVREAYQSIIQSLAISLGILLFVAVLAGGAGIYASRRLTAPLFNLTSTATRIAGGELDLEVQPQGPTEIVHLATAFNSMTQQLRELINSLEQRIEARTQRLETVATLSERLVAILNVDELLAEMVSQIKNTFGYYHAHVYLLDERGQNLIMAQGAGQAGAEMKARGHSIPLDAPHSLVARAARTGEIVRVDNVREAEDWLPNPLLPETYSEMAVPIVLEGQVVGVLDVQQNKIAGLDEGDANLLRSLVNQVAIAIHNARLFNQVEKALADAYAAQERYIEQSWNKTKFAPQSSQYLYAHPDAPPLDEVKVQALAEARQQFVDQTQPRVLLTGGHETPAQSLVAPVQWGSKTIGKLQLYTANRTQPWHEDDLAVIEAVMEQLAQTAENLRLFEETRQTADYERLFGEITRKIRQAPNLEALSKIAAETISNVLGVSDGLVQLGNIGAKEHHLEGENGHGR